MPHRSADVWVPLVGGILLFFLIVVLINEWGKRYVRRQIAYWRQYWKDSPEALRQVRADAEKSRKCRRRFGFRRFGGWS